MGLLDSFEAENNAAADDMLRRPAPNLVQPTKFNAWKTTTAAPRGVAAGANESTGFMADVIGAFGQVMGATDARPGMFGAQTEEQRKQEQAARTKMLEQGLDFDAGDQFRSAAKMFMPDAETAHTSENIMFGLGRFATKAVGYSVAAGPTAGAALVGLDEGLTAADDLKQQGVDVATRTKVGAVAGVAGAAGVLLPVAGKGVAKTVGLVAAGGPGAFVAQQAATRQILQDADYAKLADQYDPFDPVGLAVATLVPAGFGAMAMRGAKIRAKAADVKPPEGALLPEQAPVLPERAKPTPEQVDAARVDMLTQHMESARLTPPEDVVGSRAHDEAMTRAMDQMARGERVEVLDVARGEVPPGFVASIESAPEPTTRSNVQPIAATVDGDAVDVWDALTSAEDLGGRGAVIEAARDMVRQHPTKVGEVLRTARDLGYDLNSESGFDLALVKGADGSGVDLNVKASSLDERQGASVDVATADRTDGAATGRQRVGVDAPVTSGVDRQSTAIGVVAHDGVSPRLPEARRSAEADGVMVSEAPYNRFTNGGPDMGVGYMMFADGDPERVSGYGRNHYTFDPSAIPTDAVVNADSNEFRRLVADALGRHEDKLNEYQASAKDLSNDAAPANIVDSAGLWDAPDLVEIVWNDVLEPNGWRAVLTPDGAVVFDKEAVRNAAPNVQDAQQARSGTSSSDAQQPGQSTQPARQSAGGVAQAGAREQGAGVSGPGGGAAEAGLVAQRLTEIQQQFPDLTVQMDGMDKPVKLSDFLEQVQRDAMDGTDFELGGNDAPLMQLAASCFLLNG